MKESGIAGARSYIHKALSGTLATTVGAAELPELGLGGDPPDADLAGPSGLWVFSACHPQTRAAHLDVALRGVRLLLDRHLSGALRRRRLPL